ncbi:gamma-butyrobetaine hydroxylase-like domain-containing protein [Cochlodiniinecator piscidefendens]|uniref:gamma-butyrobetaine hydroxylase-like domain-containing protein n=1 Tax=Cochlodiniinecator piscidefendens TaxID=2715756 RepID=UPI00140A5D40|nr:gamma-butyrobetaine hydroxylase-like domain-containing protein [Cochlodiniinecator piscidefendens]
MLPAHHTLLSAIIQNGLLVLKWADNHESRFHAIWLRHQCWCSECGTPETGVRSIRLAQFDENMSFGEIALTEEGLSVTWPDENHTSVYSARWLRNHCYSEPERQKRCVNPVLWDGALSANLPIGSLTEAEADPSARLHILEAVRDHGFCKIIDAPTDPAEASRMINLVGTQRQTHFGTYTLKKKEKRHQRWRYNRPTGSACRRTVPLRRYRNHSVSSAAPKLEWWCLNTG